MEQSGQTSIFDSGARARSSDPQTSKAAAASVVNMRASHRRVLAMFTLYGDMTDEQLADSLHDAEKQGGLKTMSPSGVRSRRSELSKPNSERIEEIVTQFMAHNYGTEKAYRAARAQLLIEGVKSPLWDTGERRVLSTGRQAIVWGLAR